MVKLPRYDLTHNAKNENWDLKNGSGKTVKSFDLKSDATKGGALADAIGGPGSVRIHKVDGKIQEERTFPGSADPRKSKG